MAGKAVRVTGAGQGSGRERAAVLHERGALVAVVDIDERAAEATAASLGPAAHAFAADVADRARMR
ncbi:SDR family NAD(P)-dependent oxidoreductase, partial [Nocardia neocaledoniensis]|uniref:SDR family NAD(P)-dependent oxidoreductase n=1 Tax=Nocardia neocaledoniensis TaxID=236511 RepID=UPI00313BC7FA